MTEWFGRRRRRVEISRSGENTRDVVLALTLKSGPSRAGERIRDKMALSKHKGLWMGGFVPLGLAM